MKLLVLFAAAGSATLLYTFDTPQALVARNLRLPLQPANHVSRLSSRSLNTLHARGLGSKLKSCIGGLCGKSSVTRDQSTRGPGYTRASTRTDSPEPPDRAAIQLVPMRRNPYSLSETTNPQPQSSPATPRTPRAASGPPTSGSPASRPPTSSPVHPSTSRRLPPLPQSATAPASSSAAAPLPGPGVGPGLSSGASSSRPQASTSRSSESAMQQQAVTSRRTSLDRSWLQHANSRGSGASGTDPMPAATLPRVVADLEGATPSTWFRSPYSPLIRAQRGIQHTNVDLSSRSSSGTGSGD